MPARVCLNMIVKDEAHVIRRCLDSVRPFVDYWVIVDTGSTDGTQAAIAEHFSAIPGELHERPWRDFGHNRTQALELARGKADYLLVMDADNIFCAPQGWRWPDLNADGYHVMHRSAGIEYGQCVLVAGRLPWRFVGVVHEYITTDAPHRIETLPGAWIDRRHEGARSRDPATFRNDAAILERALAAEPGNARYAFYLAQSLRDAGEVEKARDAYRRRAAMQGFDEETWFALYEAARLSERLGAPDAEVQRAYLAAYDYRPRRAEPLVQLARWHRTKREWALARLFARAAQATPRPPDLLFVDEAAYRFSADDEAAIAAYWTGHRQECFDLCSALLDGDRLPDEHRARVEANRDYCVEDVAASTARYPADIVRRLSGRAGVANASVTLTVTTHRRRELFERTMNSFLNCCRDVSRIDRFVCVDDASPAADVVRMRELYPFFEFVVKPAHARGLASSMNLLLDMVQTPFWLHLEDDWQFFLAADYLARSLSILECEPSVAQVMFNRNFAQTPGDRVIAGGTLRRTPETAARYLLNDLDRPQFAIRPSLMRTGAMRAIGRFEESRPAFEDDFAARFAESGWRSAFFDTVACVHLGHTMAALREGRSTVYAPDALWAWQ
jgi:glycosyltransferase involved in cell wall biosynthesis